MNVFQILLIAIVILMIAAAVQYFRERDRYRREEEDLRQIGSRSPEWPE